MNKIIIRSTNDNNKKSSKKELKRNINEIKEKIGGKIKEKRDTLINKLRVILK